MKLSNLNWDKIRKVSDLAVVLMCLVSFAIIIWDIGFFQDITWLKRLESYYVGFIHLIVFFQLLRFDWSKLREIKITFSLILDALFLLTFLGLSITLEVQRTRGIDVHHFLNQTYLGVLVISIFSFCIYEFLKHSLKLEEIRLNPSLLFMGSFALVILSGAAMLMLPRATPSGIRFVDALFTSASAVCVTGLTVVDTANDFTRFGQNIVLGLIQIGGLGIMTFTGLAGYFLKGGSSLESRIILKEMVNAEAISQVFSILGKIIFVTFTIELLGVLLLYSYLPSGLFPTPWEKWHFSIFHSISAFCNAGFSTFSAGLFDAGIRHNYAVQLIIASLVIVGGIGFVIVFDFYKYFKHFVRGRFRQIIFNEDYRYRNRTVNIHSQMVVTTTAALLVIGTVVFYFLERNSTLCEHGFVGQWIGAFFCSVTPRTAGFNVIDMTSISMAAVLVTIMLMYIGASPGSTGGGIKTTVFAVGILNIYNAAVGRKKIEFRRREIAETSVNKAFSIITISLIAISLFTLLLTLSEPDKKLGDLMFETFSAYGTVGLTLGVTPNLSEAGKLILTLTMFAGRVGLFTIFIGLLPDAHNNHYRLPEEDVIVV